MNIVFLMKNFLHHLIKTSFLQEKVYQEVLAVVGSNEPIDVGHLPNLKNTMMVVLETLRLFPPVQYLMRKATHEVDLGKLVIFNFNVSTNDIGNLLFLQNCN